MRFDLTAEDSISAHGIWDSIRFANFCDSIWSCKIWEPNPWIRNVYAVRILVGPLPFHKHNNNIASENASSATKESKCQLGWRRDVPGEATYKWPTRDILGVNHVERLSNPATAGQEVPEHSGNFCQRRTPLQCCGSNRSCLPQQTIGIDRWVTAA